MCQLSNYFWGAGRENVQIIFRGYKLIDLLVLTKAVFVLVWSFPFVESLINWLFSQSDNKSLHLCFQIIVFQILLHNLKRFDFYFIIGTCTFLTNHSNTRWRYIYCSFGDGFGYPRTCKILLWYLNLFNLMGCTLDNHRVWGVLFVLCHTERMKCEHQTYKHLSLIVSCMWKS